MSSKQEFQSSTRGAWSYGLTTFAGVMLATLGLFQVLEGISAIAKDTVLLRTPNYVFSLDITGWGWIHLILGLLAVLVGICVLLGQTWARVAGIALAVLSALSSFMFIPYQPIWSIVIIGFDIAVIWALAAQLEAEG